MSVDTEAVRSGVLPAGRPAPDFELPDQHGSPLRLSSLQGRRPAVVVFFPWAFTGVCTGELHELQEALPRLDERGQVMAVSCDSMFALRVFAEREGLTFPLLSDFWPHGAAARSYGVLDEERGCALRGTFVVDEAGMVRWRVVNTIPNARDVEGYLEALAGLAGSAGPSHTSPPPAG